jgi:hypothetical protein
LRNGGHTDSPNSIPSDQPIHLETEKQGHIKIDEQTCLEGVINNFRFDAFFDFDPTIGDELDSAGENEVKYTLFIAEDKLQECPRIFS